MNLEPSSNYIALFEKENAEVAAGTTPTIGMAYESEAQTWSNAQKIVPIKDLAGNPLQGAILELYGQGPQALASYLRGLE